MKIAQKEAADRLVGFGLASDTSGILYGKSMSQVATCPGKRGRHKA